MGMYRTVTVEHECDDREECDADDGAAGYQNGGLGCLITSTM